MSLINKKYDVSELAEIGTNGFTAASFPQIRDAVASKMKEIYGNDIDLSSASADGQYVNMEALILNNVYRALESLAKSLNPADASGKYLDILASFSGAFRQQPTNSVAQLYVWNTGAAPISPDQIVCMDKSGNEWVWYNPVDYLGQTTVTIPAMNLAGGGTNYVPYGPLEFRCKTFGSVIANGDPNSSNDYETIFNRAADVRGGDIYQTIDAGSIQVYQKDAATVGKDLESDASLRSRRNLSFGLNGATVRNSLTANLLDIEGVEDVWVFNNNTGDARTMDDGVSVDNHDVYVVVWKDPALNITDTTFDQAVGSVIYNQLTPGVETANNAANPATILWFQLPVALSNETDPPAGSVADIACTYNGQSYAIANNDPSTSTIPAGVYISIDPDTMSAYVVSKNLLTRNPNYQVSAMLGTSDTIVEGTLDAEFGTYGLYRNYDIQITQQLSTEIRWKQCCPMAPSLRITGKVLNQSTLSAEQQNAVLESLVTYFNNIRLDEYAYGNEAIISAQIADFKTPQYGLPTYTINSIEYYMTTTSPGWNSLVARKLPLTRFAYDLSDSDYYSFNIDASGNITIYLNCAPDINYYSPWTWSTGS